MNQMIEENPFEDEQIAQEWISSVENERGRTRDREIYPRLEGWISKVKPAVVVEIGSGQGICSSKLGDFSGRYIGIEPSKHLVTRANNLYGKDTTRNFQIGNAYSLPLDDNCADAVFSVNVWFHLENLDKASGELARILKPSAHFLIVTANPEVYEEWESFYYDYEKHGKKLDGRVKIPVNDLSRNILYMHTLEEIKSAIENNGLLTDKVETFGDPNGDVNKELFVALIGRGRN